MRAPLAAALSFVSALVALLPITARAEVERFSVDYQADAGCPGEDAFVRELTARTNQVELVAKSSGNVAAHRLRVRVTQSEGRSEGRIVIAEATGPALVRKVDGQTCREVVSGLALIAALALDPDASLAPIEDQPPVAPAVAAPELPDTPLRVDTPSSKAPVMRASDSPWRVVVGAIAGGTAGLLPVAHPFASVFAELEKHHAASMRLALEYGVPTTVSVDERSARLAWAAARLTGCPLGFSPLTSVWLAPCAGLDAGLVWGSGNEGGAITQASSGRWPWLALVASLQARFDLGPIVPMIEGGAFVPLLRETFVFERPTVELHRIAPVVAFVQAGIGIRL